MGGDITRFSDLNEPWSRLVRLMQSMNFGKIEQLGFDNGDPVMDGSFKKVSEYKIGGHNQPRTEIQKEDFALHSKVIELIALVKKLQKGNLRCLVIKHGLPFLMEVEETEN
jgi:hypothetical protein